MKMFVRGQWVDKAEKTEVTSAIQAGLEHVEGYCTNVFLPYVTVPGEAPRYQQLIATPRDGEVFGADA